MEDMMNPCAMEDRPKPMAVRGPRQLSAQPITTVSSVLGIRFDGGVVVAGDIAGNYGRMQMFTNCPRIIKVHENCLVACTGDYADFQYLRDIIEDVIIDDERHQDGFQLKPRSIHTWLSRVLYNRRNKFDPLWTNFLVAGIQDGKTFLGYTDKLGTAFETEYFATGFGNYLATGMLREAAETKGDKLTKEEAVELMKKCLRVLYYRDALAYNRYQIGIVSAEGAHILGPFQLDSDWTVAKFVKSY